MNLLLVRYVDLAQQTRCEDLRLRLMEACDSAGIHPPLNAFVTLPPKLQALTLH